MGQKISEKLKEGVSVKEIEEFARKHTIEAFSVLAIVIATISSMFDFFTGPVWSVLFTAVGMVLAVICAESLERGVKKCYQFVHKQEKFTQMVLGIVKIVLALFIPFVIFLGIGVLAGTAYHYYIRRCQIASGCCSSVKTERTQGSSSEEHD